MYTGYLEMPYAIPFLLFFYGVCAMSFGVSNASLNEDIVVKFTNEYASREDIDDLNLSAIYGKHFCGREKASYRGGDLQLTIDRENNIFLLPLGQGHGEEGNRTMFLLRYDDQDIRFDLKLVGGSKNFNERPFVRVWDLAYINLSPRVAEKEKEILSAIKSAMTVYGYSGISKQVPDTLVKFNF